MVIPSPPQPLDSLDMYIFPTFASMLETVPYRERPEVRRLVLRLSALYDESGTTASHDALIRTISHYRGVRTLYVTHHLPYPIHYDSSRSLSTPTIFSDDAVLPELESLILKRAEPRFDTSIQSLLARAAQVSYSGCFVDHR